MTTKKARIEWKKSARVLSLVAALSLTTESFVFASGNDMSGSCLNDVGRGAAIWGTSSEVTTYSEPYLPRMTPEIYRIPMTSEQASQAPETVSGFQGHTGNAMERLTESGTIFGTDGKLYEYTYVRGVEPRRIVETRKVQNSAGKWVDEKTERIEWRPVLVRVLRPAGTNARLEQQEAALRAAIATPAPCEPAGAAEAQTFADSSTDAGTAATGAQSQATTATPPAPPVEGEATDVSTPRAGASVRVSTPAATVGPEKRRPVLVLPEEARRNVQQSQTRAQNAQNAGGKTTTNSPRTVVRPSAVHTMATSNGVKR